MLRCAHAQKGFTLVEAVIGVVLAAMLMISAYQVFSYISRQRSRGDVDLQELQGARHAINYLRRDFRSATPQIADTATLEQKRKALRMPIVEASSFSIGNEAVPVLISDGEIHFFKHVYDTPDGVARPATEQVNYRIDSAHKTGDYKFFEMTTTISSAITSPFINNPYWHIAEE